MMPHAAFFTDQLAQIYASHGKIDAAIQISVEALSILDRDKLLRERNVDGLLHTVGLLFLQVGRVPDAESALENALNANPNRTDTRSELIRHYRSIGKEQKASEHEKYLASNTEPPAATQP